MFNTSPVWALYGNQPEHQTQLQAISAERRYDKQDNDASQEELRRTRKNPT